MFRASPTLLLFLCATAVSVRSQSSCSIADEEALKQRRIQAIKASILAQLGLDEPPSVQGTSPYSDPEVVRDFRVVSQMTELMEEAREKMCQSSEHLAQAVTSFVGSVDRKCVVISTV